MDATRWKQIDDLLDAALAAPEPLRAKLVRTKAGRDDDLRDRVLELLQAQADADTMLDGSAIDAVAKALAENETRSAANDLIDKRIATYRVERMIGAGGMGRVYLAHDEKLNRKVALKVLPPEFLSGSRQFHKFEAEARAIAKLNHPGIITVYDVGTSEGINYISTELVEGKTLRELMGQQISVRDAVISSIQILDALAVAHAEGIIHRDIKPENIMIREDGYPKLLDFGIAVLTGSEETGFAVSAANGMMVGTPAYMSPSQISDEPVDHRTDLWSCGVVLYETLTGINPFNEATNEKTFQAILSKQPAPCSSLNPAVPEELDRIAAKLLEKDPSKGYQSAQALRADLKDVRKTLDLSLTASEDRPYHQRPALLFAAAAMMLVAFPLLWYFAPWTADPTMPEWSSGQNTQLTFQAGTEAYPSLSPDGQTFAFAANTNGNDDIYIQKIGDSAAVNLTPDSEATDTMPVFSPDGGSIAFRSDREPAGIYVMNISGENIRRVTDFGYSPSWSPDGKHIAVAANRQDIPAARLISSIWVVNVESCEKKMLVDNYALQPAWSPDGKRIAYWFTGQGGNRIVATIPAEGGDPVIFAEASNTNWNPVWSPDGKYLYYASDRRGNMAFWRSRIDTDTGKATGEHEIVVTPSKYNRHLSFSADGKRMVYVQTSNRSNIQMARFDIENESIHGEPVPVTSGDFEFSAPELSADGSFFVSRLIRETQDDIVLIDARTGAIRDLTNDAPFDRYVRLSPDDREIIFSSDSSGSYQIWAMNLDEANPRQLTFFEKGIVSIPVWSPDGKRISFDDENLTYIINLDEAPDIGKAETLPRTENGGFFRVWDWSPDGKRLAGSFDTAHGPGVGYFSFDTRKYERIADFAAIPRWLPDGRRMIFERNGRPMIAETDPKRVREILPGIRDYIRNIAVSRDGKTIYYTTRESESNIWMLDLNENIK